MVFDTDDDLGERQAKTAKRLDEQNLVDTEVFNAVVKFRLQFDAKKVPPYVFANSLREALPPMYYLDGDSVRSLIDSHRRAIAQLEKAFAPYK